MYLQHYNISREDFTLDGCILYTEEQLIKLLQEKGVDMTQDGDSGRTRTRHKRQVDRYVAGDGQQRKWPMPVPFKFDGDHSTFQKIKFHSVILLFCLFCAV